MIDVTVGVDVGGTKVLAGVVDPQGTVLDLARSQTPGRDRSPPVVEDAIADAVRGLAARHPVCAVGVAAAGFVDAAGSVVRFSPHLSWREEPLRTALATRLGLPVVVDNDANAAARAETRFGAARGVAQAVCITLGTEIGGALLVDGQVVRGANGMAGEFGHMQVEPSGRGCECGNRGCWEQYASGSALVRAARRLLEDRPSAAPVLRALVDDDPVRLTGHHVSDAARAGERTALDLFAEMGAWLGMGLANLAAAFDPALVVVGGGMSAAGELLLGPAREAMLHGLTGRGFRTEPVVVTAELGEAAGLVGAADLALASLPR